MAPTRIHHLLKLAKIVQHPALWRALRRRTFAAVEHIRIFRTHQFDTILDVGANVGQFAVVAHAFNPGARIYSFEPISSCYGRLKTLTKDYPRIEPVNVALGAYEHVQELNITNNSTSSSLLRLHKHTQYYPDVSVVQRELVRVAPLDDVVPQDRLNGRVLCKLDIQGYELEALKGAQRTIDLTDAVYCEVSFQELFLNQPLAGEIIAYLRARGFEVEHTYRVDAAQADLLFTRR
jgi:FkbM family methyltransferase